MLFMFCVARLAVWRGRAGCLFFAKIHLIGVKQRLWPSLLGIVNMQCPLAGPLPGP